MLILLAPYLMTYWDLLWAYPLPRLISILLAGFWTWFGPYLILRWYSFFEYFLSKIDEIPGSNGVAHKAYQKKVLHFRCNKLIRIIWVLAIITILLLPIGRQTLTTYYLYGFNDINYWIFIICVGYIALFTSSFILFMIYSGLEVKSIMENEAVVSQLLQNVGKHISMSLIGELIAKTSVYFCSGFFFFPIMIVFYFETQNVTLNTSAAVFILMGIFITLIGIYLGIMNRIVCEKAQSSKDKLMENLEIKLHKMESCGIYCRETEKLILYTVSRQEIRQQLSEISKICTNPLEANQYMKIIYGILMSAILPAITGFMLDMLKF
ncbi:MAG: hypothetical protein NC489_24100 [Ruminococcus flavefaciens]|nr:hypothetical protein [Ruminococcus flavefaciens]